MVGSAYHGGHVTAENIAHGDIIQIVEKADQRMAHIRGRTPDPSSTAQQIAHLNEQIDALYTVTAATARQVATQGVLLETVREETKAHRESLYGNGEGVTTSIARVKDRLTVLTVVLLAFVIVMGFVVYFTITGVLQWCAGMGVC